MTPRNTTLNVELLRAGLDAIEAHPSQWDAHAWATRADTGHETYSLAARVCLLAGCAIDWARVNEWGNATWLTDRRAIPDAANELLGLGLLDAHKLFDVANDIPRTRKIATRLIKRAKAGR
jgi:hypothetical protein